MFSSLHPIAFILNEYLNQPQKTISKLNINEELILSISNSLIKGQQLNSVLKNDEFSFNFDLDFLINVVETKNSPSRDFEILLSSIAWILRLQNHQNINNLDILLESILLFNLDPKSKLKVYELINYIIICTIKSNVHLDFQTIHDCLKKFICMFIDVSCLFEDIIRWLLLCIDHDSLSLFGENLLFFLGDIIEDNLSLFTLPNQLCLFTAISPIIKKLHKTVLNFIAKIEKDIHPKHLEEIINVLIESISTYCENCDKNNNNQKLEHQTNYIKHKKRIELSDFKLITSYSFQINDFLQNIYVDYPDSCIYIFPQIYIKNMQMELLNIGNAINKNNKFNDIIVLIDIIHSIIIGFISINFEKNSIYISDKLCETSSNFFQLNEVDDVAFFNFSFFIITIFNKLFSDKSKLTSVVLNSFIFDPQVTIFDNFFNENDYILRYYSKIILRNMVYRYLIFVDDLSIRLFFSKFISIPLIISEFFFLAGNFLEVSENVFNGDLFLHYLYTTILSYYHLNSNYKKKLLITNMHNNESKDSSSFFKWFLKYFEDENLANSNNINEDYHLENEIQCVLVNSFAFISNALKNKSMVAKWSQSMELIPAIYSMIYDESIRNVIMTILINLMKDNNDDIITIIELCTFTIFNQNLTKLLEDVDFVIISSLVDLLSHNTTDEQKKIIAHFQHSINTLLLKNSNYSISKNLLNSILSFYSYSEIPIKSKVRAAIESLISRIFKDDPKNDIFYSFIKIITSFNNTLDYVNCLNTATLYNESVFLIKQPKMIPVFFSLFITSKLLPNVIMFVDSLCVSSLTNAKVCHSNKIDQFILQLLDNNFQPKIVSLLLKLFSHIAIIASSMSVVSQYISLFCPINREFISPNINNIIQTVIELFLSAQQQPIAYLPLSQDSQFILLKKFYANSVSTISNANDKFSLVFLVYIDNIAANCNKNSSLIHVFDKSNHLHIFIKNQNIFIKTYKFASNNSFEDLTNIDNNDSSQKLNKKTIFFPVRLPTKCWVKFMITFYKEQKKVDLVLLNNPKSTLDLSFPDFIINNFSISNRVSFAIGGGSCNSSNAVMLGSFSWYQPKDDLDFLNLQNPYFSIDFKNDQSLLSLNITKRQGLSFDANLFQSAIIYPLSFPYVLTLFFKAEIVLPIFAQLDFLFYQTDTSVLNKFKSKTNAENKQNLQSTLALNALNMLGSILQINKETQEEFSQSKGVEILSFLLTSNSQDNLTYDLFLNFILLYDKITSLTLKKKFLKFIIMNVNILSKTSPDNQNKAVQYWNDYFFKRNPNLVVETFPIHILIHHISRFFSLSQLNGNNIKQETRTGILQLLLNISDKQFTYFDFISLIQECIASPNHQFTMDILLMIRLLTQLQNTASNILKQNEFYFYSLNYLLSCENFELIYSIIDTFIALYDAQILKSIDVYVHIELILLQIKPFLFNIEFIQELMNLSILHPEVLPVPCFIAVSSNSNAITEVIVHHLLPNPKFALTEFWYFWLIIMAIKYEQFSLQILKFIINSSLSQINWRNIFVLIEIIGKCFQKNTVLAKRIFFQVVSTLLLDSKYDINKYPQLTNALKVKQFLKLALVFILTKNKNFYENCSSALKNLYKSSIFYDKFDPSIYKDNSFNKEHQPTFLFNFIEDTNEGNKLYLFNIIKNIAEQQFDPQEFVFTLDLNEDGIWLDKKLSDDCIKIITKYKVTDFYEFRDALLKINVPLLVELFENSVSLINYAYSKIPIYSSYIYQKHQKALDFSQTYSNQFDEFYSKSFIEYSLFERKIDEKSNNLKKMWSNLWHQLTFDRGPWHKSIPLEASHFKRDQRLFSCFSPIKLKQNKNYTVHKDASLSRDIGIPDKVMKKYEEYQIELEEKYKKCDLPSLLTIRGFHDDKHNDLNDSQIPDEHKRKQYNAKYITLVHQCDCKFVLSPTKLQIIYNCQYEGFKPTQMKTFVKNNQNINQDNTSTKIKTIHSNLIKYILFRSFLHLESSLEIITKYGKSYFIMLYEHKSLNVLKYIASMPKFQHALIQKVHHLEFIQSLQITTKWSKGKLSNFEYLMKLNIFGGRSFKEPSLYPLFPWILKDYNSKSIDLNDPKIYRDFSKPVGTFTEKRLNELIKRKRELENFGKQGFLYSSCYVSPLLVFLWLIRTEPFTTLHIDLQSGKFDHSSRIFSSISEAFKMASSHVNDYRELIPEFFICADFLQNRNNFDLGKINNIPVNDVILPNWCNEYDDLEANPFISKATKFTEFIYIHRKALESQITSKSLNNWIDLIFGYKQRGKAADDNDNTFDPNLYENVWENNSQNDPSKRAVIEAFLQHCGHIPNQLFTSPHPSKEFKTRQNVFQTQKFPFEINSPIIFAHFYSGKKKSLKFEHKIKILKCIILLKNGSILKPKIISTEQKLITHEDDQAPIEHNFIFKNKGLIDLTFLTSAKTISYEEKNDILYIGTNTGNIDSICPKKANPISSKFKKVVNHITVSLSSPSINENKILRRSFSSVDKSTLLLNHSGTLDKETHFCHNGQVNFILTSKNIIVSCGIDATINIWSKDFKEMRSVNTFRSELTCCDLNEKYATIVSGTRDGSILYIDIDTCSTTNVVNISPEIPTMVKITSGWGFVTVCSTKADKGKISHFIALYDINAQLLRKKQIDSPFVAWCTWKSFDGFDYFIATNINGTLFSFEAFYLNINELNIPKMQSKIVSLSFCPKYRVLSILRDNGTIYTYSENDLNFDKLSNSIYGKP